MSTAEKLEAITDEGKFELLATAVICKAARDYRAVLHSGLNAQGQPIKSPVDGFCRVPSSIPPHYIHVEHTTTSKDQLEKKWLFDHTTVKASKSGRKKQPSESDDGDLLKANRLAQSINRDFPDARFTVVLTTNQRLDSETCLKVEKEAEKFGLAVDFWDQSRLARFLDTEPEGQWLRKEYLHDPAEMLSESLLHNLCEQSLEDYRQRFLNLTDPNNWVGREIDDQVARGLASRGCTIQLLIGESGSGKSTAVYQIGKKYLAAGGYSLWASDDLLKESERLANVLDKVLRNLCPSLLPDVGRAALQLLRGNNRILLIADDVNRANDPAKLLQKLVGWSKPVLSNTNDSKPVYSLCLIICPVWSEIARLISPDFNQTSWISSAFIGAMTPTEGATAIREIILSNGMEATNTEAITLAEKLGNDPILIGLFGSLLLNAQISQLSSLAENVIEQFITTAIAEVASRSGSLLRDEYRSALTSLTSHMLTNRNRYPSLTEIQAWLGSSSCEMFALRELIKHEKLCRLEKGKLDFRHDRIREALLVESMGQLLENSAQPLDIFFEPFYAEIIGQAIVRYPQSQDFLRELRDRLPLALVEAVRCFGTPNNGYHQTIIDGVKEWVDSFVVNGFTLDSVLAAVCWSLLEIDSPVVLEITEKFPRGILILLARFRNGCTISGVKYLTLVGQRDCVFLSKDNLRDRLIEQAKRHHRKKLLEELKQLLICPTVTDKERKGILALAGFLGFPDFQDEIQTCWELADNKGEILPEAIWASIQCSVSQSGLLDSLLEYWDNLPPARIESEYSRKSDPTVGISAALECGIHNYVIKYLISQTSKYKSLRSYIEYAFRSVDSPDAIEFVVRSAADTTMKEHPQGFARQTSMLADAWNPVFPDSRRLSQASMERLKNLWAELDNDCFLKRIAFHVWEMGIDQEEIETLQRISPDSPCYRQALWKRAKLSDFSIVSELLLFLVDEIDWLHAAYCVWCSEVMAAVKPHIQTLAESIPKDFSDEHSYEQRAISRLIAMIPKEDAERLLDEYWKSLGYSTLFIQTAFYVGTSRCLKLAKFSLNQCPKHISVFKHFSLSFYLVYANSEKYMNASQLQKLVQNLLPHIDRFDDFELWQLAEACKKFGIAEWSQQNIAHKLTDKYRKRCHPSNNDLFKDLEGFVASSNGLQKLTIWLEGHDKKNDLAPSVVNQLLIAYPTTKGLQIAARCFQSIATRKDLPILDQYEISGSPAEIAKLKANVQFTVYRRSLN